MATATTRWEVVPPAMRSSTATSQRPEGVGRKSANRSSSPAAATGVRARAVASPSGTAVEPPVVAVAEVEDALGHRHGPAAVLVHAGPHADTSRRDVDRLLTRADGHDDLAAPVIRPALGPVGHRPVRLQPAAGDLAGGHHGRRDG